MIAPRGEECLGQSVAPSQTIKTIGGSFRLSYRAHAHVLGANIVFVMGILRSV